ncbi:MAG: translation initiation factor IF-2 [Saprospiraceae bacterium]|nr:translation initiation factor IF-2 [Saprospiraceae bacterium]MCF8249533.1 translation initiation factor IF-2 [Saprospiraceae bacterium]MCF8281283.1 translation initiation factor IF-2 [Bacteroidales bacterium]MCF8310751.1 translation initiation factor IF-2 [Saprospiraceae bacterium]MCF8439418.1 translation initiation factor IF-2 [Saprospiraceae bacterium]
MDKRLVKVAQELNVGTATIVEFLGSKGFHIDNKPTSKVTEEMESLLLKEYQKDMAEKVKADAMTIGVRPALVKKEPLPPLIRRTEPAPPPPPPPPPLIKKEEPLPVVTAKEVAEPAPVVEPTPVVEETPVVVEERSRPKVDGLKIKGKIELDKKGMPVRPKKVAEKPADEKPSEPEVVETPAAVADDKEPPTVPAGPVGPTVAKVPTEVVTDGVDEDELVRMGTPELRGLKILGKIEIAKRKEPAAKPVKKKAGSERAGDRSVRGDKSRPVASSDTSDDSARRKRKRKKVLPQTPQPGAASPSQGTGDRRRRGAPAREVSGKEAEEQIRKTMASLSGAGKKKRQKMRRETRERVRERQELRDMEGQSDKLEVTEFVTVQELANMMDVSATEVITTCMSLGVFVSINQRLDAELIELVASEFGHEVQFISVEDQTDFEEEEEDAPEDLKPRSPIITVMGHVDHGKTSLLDYIREAKVVSGEAGGITQHIGAYEVTVNDRSITFLDTPGHEAFTAMRARGTKVTDIAIIVIAADDNIMPQTKEAISHAQAATVPMVFAINKIDKEGADPGRIKQELASMNLLIEEWGGNYQSMDISAKTGEGVDQLLDKVLLVADLAELKANPDRNAIGTVLEASLDKGKGYVSKMLVQTGTLKIGDAMVAGEYAGKVKAMFNERGQRITEAGPSAPVLVLGLSGAPTAGERFKIMDDESESRQLASKRAQINREQATRATKRISLDEIGRRLALGTFKELNLIVKGDVDGSVEALSDALIKLALETVQVNVIHKAVGQIVESDVLLASASDAIIIGFQVRPSVAARKLAEREGVEIKMYSIIYEAIEEIKLAIEGMLEPTKEEKIVANIEIREVYKISKVGTVAGCYVLDGKLTRNTHIRLVRDGIVIFPTKEGANGRLGSLKRVKDDVKEVKSGMECGLTIDNYNDMKEGDIVEGYEITEVKQKYGG